MLRGVLRVDCMVMRPLEALSTPLAAAKLLGIAEALALVLTPADSLHNTLSVSNTPVNVIVAGNQCPEGRPCLGVLQ